MATRRHPPLDGLSVFITTTVDGRRPLFADGRLAEAVRSALLATAAKEGVTIHAWVIMPDHMHLLLNLGERNDLGHVMQLIKGRSARAVNALRRTTGKVWQKRFDERVVSDERDFWQKVDYIHANPVRARLVEEVGEYRFSSAWPSPEPRRPPVPPMKATPSHT